MTRRPLLRCEVAERGSILLLVLLMSLAMALLIQVMVTVTVCAERAISDETLGRTRMGEKDDALAAMVGAACRDWQPYEWRRIDGDGAGVEGAVSGLEESDWVRQAMVRQEPSTSKTVVSAWLERGRDGLDLPRAAIVAASVATAPGRVTPWLRVDATVAGTSGAASTAMAFVGTFPDDSLLGEGCAVTWRSGKWRLDAGWTALIDAGLGEMGRQEVAAAPVAFGEGTLLLTGAGGRRLSLSESMSAASASAARGQSPESPLLVLATGDVLLDARDLGDVFGVIVADGGMVLLDGTTVHGAVFVTGSLDGGLTGCVEFSLPVLRWATDCSLWRVRLMPGTRREGTE